MKTYTIKNSKNAIYDIAIVKEKYEEVYRLCNLTKAHLTPCGFKSYQEAEQELFDKQSAGEIEILVIKGE